MMLTFVLIAGSLAAGAALLLLLPLLRRRADARPVSAVAAVAVLLVMLLGGAGLYAAFSNYSWTAGSVADTPAAMTARLAKRLARQSGTRAMNGCSSAAPMSCSTSTRWRCAHSSARTRWPRARTPRPS